MVGAVLWMPNQIRSIPTIAMAIPVARYKVSLDTKACRGGHFYSVEGLNEKFRGITTFIGVIAKPALIAWSRKEALESARRAFYEAGDEESALNWRAFVDSVIAKASKRPKE